MGVLLILALAGCWGDNAYIVEGTVLDKPSPTRIVVAHEDIPGLMEAMTMPFDVRDPALLEEVDPGDRIYARLRIEQDGGHLARVRVVGQGTVPADYRPTVGPVPPGGLLPALEVPVTGGARWTLGEGQGRPTLLTFLYTRCPMPEFCPMVVARLQALQEQVDARLLAVTLDPEHDTLEVLEAYGEAAGARPDVWRFGRLPEDELAHLALLAGLPVTRDGDEVVHGLRFLVLDADGRLVERYDDASFPIDRVVSQLRTGEPKAPAGSDGTRTP